MERVYKRPKREAVQLTSLLDLLFVMIFVSMIQQKEVVPSKEEKPVAKPTPVEKPIEKPVTKVVEKPKPKKTKFSIRATFNFYGTKSNPKIPSGNYLMSGIYDDKTGKLELGGMAWIKRPPQYDMVPLSGVIDKASDLFKGRVEFIGCKEFTLQRKIKETTTPISGEWVGVYDCSQGSTGLTLTIQ